MIQEISDKIPEDWVISYKERNESFSKEFVYHLGCEAGFFSEYNNMILAMLYCAKHHIRFSIYSLDANFSFEKGWDDYFKPFCPEVGNIFHRWFNRRPNPRFKNEIIRFVDSYITAAFLRFNRNRLTMFDLWNEIRSLDQNHFSLPELGLEGSLRDACRKMIRYTWMYNENTQKEVSYYIESVALPEHYIGFHIRGGDKFIEARLQNIDVYIEKARSLSVIRDAFVLTDDYAIIQALEKNYPDWRFYTLCSQEEHGYYHQKFKKQIKMVIRNQHIKLFASIDILAASDLFIGTFSSNPGMYLGMRMEEGRAYSVDIPEWRIW
ncbi:hypothetical protein [Parabacteroides sp.]